MKSGHTFGYLAVILLDYVHIYSVNTRIAASRPHEFLSEQSELCRPRSRQASDEVARGRLVSLERLPFAFPAKHGELYDWP